MKILIAILAALSTLLLLSTVICGVWIRFSGEVVEQSSINFHMGIAVLSVGVTILTVILAAVRIWQLSS